MVDLAAVRMSRLAELLDAEPMIHDSTKELEPDSQTVIEASLHVVNSQTTDSRVQKAYDMYMKAYRSGQLVPDHLNNLVNQLVDILRSKIINVQSSRTVTVQDSRVPCDDVMANTTNEDGFTCIICRSVWSEPTTVACGHTYCRSCLDEQLSSRCIQCDTKYGPVSEMKTNILLSKLAEKCYPTEVAAAKLKRQQRKLCNTQTSDLHVSGKMQEQVSADHKSTDDTAATNLAHNRYQEALEHAECAIKLKPYWPKGYYRKGAALSALCQHQEAILAYLQCLALDPNMISAKTGLAKVLRTITSPTPPMNAKQVAPQRLLCTSQLAHLFSQETVQCSDAKLGFKLEHSKVPAAAPPPMHILEETVNAVTTASPTVRHLLSRKRSHTDNCDDDDNSMIGLRKQPRSEVAPSISVQRDAGTSLHKEDLECSLCLRLLYNPVTTPCGHVFCRDCLYRCLDHNATCPLCKGSLAEYLAKRRESVTESVAKLVETHFWSEFVCRKQQHENDLNECMIRDDDSVQEIPIFVCTLAYPTVPCPLHVYEPRYRLMVRRCVESGSSQFGMCVSFDGTEDNFSEYGCTLDIRRVQYLADGRSVIDTVGGRRFRIIERSMKDGYHVARVKFLHDDCVELSEQAKLSKLQSCVYNEAAGWFASLPETPRSRILQHFGPLPLSTEPASSNGRPAAGPAWLWWLTAVLPIDRRIQLSMVAKTSLADRLVTIRRILAAMRCGPASF